MDDRSSLYLGGPERDGGQVGFLFFGEKGIMVASFWVLEEGTRMMWN